MTTIEEKKAMKPLNYYNEISAYNKQRQFTNTSPLSCKNAYR